MTLYQYYGEYNVFGGTTSAALNEKETEKQGINIYLIPGKATTLATLSVSLGEVNIFKNGAWQVVTDTRNIDYYDTTTKEKKNVNLDDPIPVDYTTIKPPSFSSWDGSAWVVDLVAELDDYKGKQIILLRGIMISRLLDEDINTVKGEFLTAKTAIEGLTSIP